MPECSHYDTQQDGEENLTAVGKMSEK